MRHLPVLTEEKPVAVVVVINGHKTYSPRVVFLLLLLTFTGLKAQQTGSTYTKKVLESSELDFLFSYYNQDGNNAAVTGGEGTEELTDATSTIVLRVPINEDDILTVDVGLSTYTSASSSNVNPLDGGNTIVSPFDASSGESSRDQLLYINPSYQHSSKDRNTIWSANAYLSNEHDYVSIGFGGSYAKLFNERNTEISISGRVFLDRWDAIYPIELRPGFFDDRIVGDGTYTPNFQPFDSETRDTYSLSLNFSQIINKRLQGALFADVVVQNGLLSTPFQRVYFGDIPDFFIDDFQLADDVERLPESRFKLPIGGRLNYFWNDFLILRSYYRFYLDDWGITSHTANIETPIKLSQKFTLYPNYRFYTQTAANYFFPREGAASTLEFYTSDFDLSDYSAHQYGMGIQYKDVLGSFKVLTFGLKSVDLRFNQYNRNNGLDAFIVSLGTTFVAD